ncbi:MAG: mevalonate kinase [Nitrososphaerota archaeon]
MVRVTWSAPGKVIICGEHFVVYGGLAVAAAIDKRAYSTVSLRDDRIVRIGSKQIGTAEWLDGKLVKESSKGVGDRLEAYRKMVEALLEKYGRRKGVSVTVDSQIPRASGLGSSAAIAVATAGALLDALEADFTTDDVVNASLVAESELHYRPSGIDPTVSALGGVIRFRRGSKPQRIEPQKAFELLVIESGRPRRTGEMVRKVAQFRELHINLFDKLMEVSDMVAGEVELAIQNNRIERLGSLMTVSHNLLRAIGVSSRELDEIIDRALRAGAYGAKLTGGGGGGAVIAVASEEVTRQLISRHSDRYTFHRVVLPQEGARREKAEGKEGQPG